MTVITKNVYAGTGGVSTQILASNTDRNYAAVTNISAVGAFVAVGTTSVQGKGIPLLSSGSSYEINKNNFTTAEITGIGSGGNALLSIIEY